MPVDTKPSKRKMIDIILLVVFVLVVIGAWLLFVSNTNKQAQDTKEAAKAAETTATASQATTKKIQNLSTVVFMNTAADVSKLPSETPESFKVFMTNKLARLTSCKEKALSGVTLDKISEDFVRGAVSCNGGTVTYWYRTNNSWQELAAKSTLACVDVEKANIPIEFVSTCKNAKGEEVENPVGIYR